MADKKGNNKQLKGLMQNKKGCKMKFDQALRRKNHPDDHHDWQSIHRQLLVHGNRLRQQTGDLQVEKKRITMTTLKGRKEREEWYLEVRFSELQWMGVLMVRSKRDDSSNCVCIRTTTGIHSSIKVKQAKDTKALD